MKSSSLSREIGRSDLVRCVSQIKAMMFSLFLIIVAMIIVSTISSVDFKAFRESMKAGSDSESTALAEDTKQAIKVVKRKLTAAVCLLLLATVIFIVAILMATSKGCYQTSLFGIIFGMMFGIL